MPEKNKDQPVKERIIAAATELIRRADGDLEAVSLRRVAREAGVALGLINYHFRSKERLVEECVQGIIGGVIAAFQPDPGGAADPPERLEAVAKEVLAFLLANPALARVSILGDLTSPGVMDNTMRTVTGFSRLLGGPEDKMPLFCFTAALQATFLRRGMGRECYGFDLNRQEERDAFVRRLVAMFFPA